MRVKPVAAFTCSALLLAGTASIATSGIAPAAAASRDDAKAMKKAAGENKKAASALASKQWNEAVRHAERAVSLSPQDAGYRATLGAAYLRAGRFASADQAFTDALTLQPDNGRAALNLSLAQIAEGKWDAARRTLAGNQARIAAADRGLALALAGDTAGGVAVLTAATRAPDADAKTRQNLALAMALAGRWQEARVLVGVDMGPAEADARVQQWAVFAKPATASDQVASLLGITPAADPGQPVAIALSAPVPVNSAGTTPVDAFMPGPQQPVAPAVPAPQPVAAPIAATSPRTAVAYHDVATAVAAPPAAVASTAPVKVEMFFAPRVRRPAPGAAAAPVSAMAATKVAQPRLITSPGAYKSALTPQPLAATRQAKRSAGAKPVAVAAATAAPPVAGKGPWFVQLGAYPNAAVARDGWARASRRYVALNGYSPAGMSTSVRGVSYYRLSVGGFARGDAVQLCRGYRAKGGICFVRTAVGEQTASWQRPSVQVAKAAPAKPVAVASTARSPKRVEIAAR